MKRNKKGFTIIELVIVIAVIGVLTAVLVPVFINLTNKANKAADDSLIKNLNTALKMEEQLVGNPKNETLQDAIEDLKNEGYLLENLVSKTGHDLLWDQEQNQFVLNEKTDLKDGKYWQIVDKIPETQRFSYYAGKNFKDTEVLDLEYGFDAGEYSKIENLEYEPKSGTAKTTRIRTNSDETTLTINAPLDVVKHYGDAKALNIIAVKGSSYHENGKVSFLEISKGRVVLEHDSQVKHIHVSAKTNEQGQKLDVFDSVTIAKEPTKEMPVLSRDDVEIASTGTLVVALQNGTEEVTEQSNLDYVWLTKQGIYEQIKISDSSASAGNVWVSDSDKSQQTKTAAQQIANNFISETVRPTWESTDTERDIANINNKTEVATAVAEEKAGDAWEEMTPAEKAEAIAVQEAIVVDKDKAVEKVADKEDVEKGATLFAGGIGTKKDPFIISSLDNLANIKDVVAKENDDYVYYCLAKDIDLENAPEGYVCELTDPNQKIDLDLNGYSLSNIHNYVFENVSVFHLYNGKIRFNGNGGLIDDAASDVALNIKVNDLTLEGKLSVDTSHYGAILCYAFLRNTFDSVIEANNILINTSIDNKRSGAYTGSLFGYIQGSKIRAIITNCTMNGSIQSAYAGGFINPCSYPNGAIIVNSGNVLNGSLLATNDVLAFGLNGNYNPSGDTYQAQNALVNVSETAKMVKATQSTDLFDGSALNYGDQIIINHTNTAISYYVVAVEWWVNRNSDGTGGYPRQLSLQVEVEGAGNYATGLYKNTFKQVSSVPTNVTFIIDEEGFKVWKDGSNYMIYDEDYTLVSNLSYRYIRVYGYTANDTVTVYQIYQYPAKD